MRLRFRGLVRLRDNFVDKMYKGICIIIPSKTPKLKHIHVISLSLDHGYGI